MHVLHERYITLSLNMMKMNKTHRKYGACGEARKDSAPRISGAGTG
jgi:hypothetical protein